MKIHRISIEDFRAFPSREEFILGGDNLLVYGENGSGKSSLFAAIEEIFNLRSRPAPNEFRYYKNIFTDPASTRGQVSVEFDDGATPATWPITGTRPTADARVIDAARRKTALRYRDLLAAHYAASTGGVNVFKLLVQGVLAEMPVPVPGGGARTVPLSSLWTAAEAHLGGYHTQARRDRITNAVTDFNNALAPRIPDVERRANALLRRFPTAGLTIAFNFTPVAYRPRPHRDLGHPTITLEPSLHGRPVADYPGFFNEARLSAIALVIYLASLLESFPAGVPGATPPLKLLALDDVVLGLDAPNRVPVLEILRDEFHDWQILVFTHDRIWFEMARLYLGENWRPVELYHYFDDVLGADRPVVRGAAGFLDKAHAYLFPPAGQQRDERAAAVYARAGFEAKVKRFCQENFVRVVFNEDSHRISAEQFWAAAKERLALPVRVDSKRLHPNAAVIRGIEMFRKVVLNPGAHAPPFTASAPEIDGAIKAVAALKLEDKPLLDRSVELAGSAPPRFDPIMACCYIRAAFDQSLRNLCIRRRVCLPILKDDAMHSTRDLWTAAKAHAPGLTADATLIADIEAHPTLLLDDLAHATVSTITQPQAAALLAAVEGGRSTPLSTRLDRLP